MVMIRITGWKPGVNTVHAIKLIRNKAQIPLNEALSLVNDVLAGKNSSLRLSNIENASELVNLLNTLGMVAEITPDTN